MWGSALSAIDRLTGIGQAMTGPVMIGIAYAGVVAAPEARAGGFMLQEQSQVEIGRAFSGAAASADDPSTVWYNPAGMTELPGLQISSGATALFVTSRQEDAGSTISRTGNFPFVGPFIPVIPIVTPTQPVGGNSGGRPFDPVVPVPTGYVSRQMGDSGLWLGLGVSAPFGLKLRYDNGFFGRYDSTYSNLLTIDAQPSIAWRLSDSVSFGAGLDIQYADVVLTSAWPQPAPNGDGVARLSGDDIALGWNAGILVKLKNGIRVGLHYRSDVEHDLKGSNDLSGFTGLLSTLNGSTAIKAPLTLPGSATLSVSAPVARDTRLMLTGRWYNWSSFNQILVIFPTGTSVSKPYDYRDSWSLSAGLERRLSNRTSVRVGSMFDRTPTNPAHLSTRVPDGNRTWLSSGISHDLTDSLTLNASYAHVFIAGQTMAKTESFYGGALATTVTTRSRQSGNVDMIATSLVARF